MGEPISRLNPKIESQIQRTFLVDSTKFLLLVALNLPIKEHHKRGQQPYDYRIILVLCILRILFRKTYADYEIEMRTDTRICEILGLFALPGKSTLQRALAGFSPAKLLEFNAIMLSDWTKKKVNFLLDASGIKLVGKSIWYSIRIKKPIRRRDCSKIHVAACMDLLLILNWRITIWKKHDSPFLKVLLKPFKILGLVLADTGYSSRKNIQYIADKKGAPFIPFNKKATSKPKSHPAWKFLFNFWDNFKTIFNSIYHQRSKVESIFSTIKRRYGDMLHSKGRIMQRKEMALIFIAYNVRVLLYWRYALDHNLNLWVRA